MSGIRGKVENKIARVLAANWITEWDKLSSTQKQYWIYKARQILNEVPELAIVDREAELPEELELAMKLLLVESAVRTMLKAGWVKEIK